MSSTANKRTDLMIIGDRAKIANLMSMGYTSRVEIAEIINLGRDESQHISSASVTYDINAIKKEYTEKTVEDYKFYLNKADAEYDLLKKTYWEAYQLSRKNKISLESEEIVLDGDDAYDVALSMGMVVTTENSTQRLGRIREEQRLEGNPAFLAGVQSCIDKQAKLHGVDGVNKVAMTDATGTKDSLDILTFMKNQMSQISKDPEETKLLDE